MATSVSLGWNKNQPEHKFKKGTQKDHLNDYPASILLFDHLTYMFCHTILAATWWRNFCIQAFECFKLNNTSTYTALKRKRHSMEGCLECLVLVHHEPAAEAVGFLKAFKFQLGFKAYGREIWTPSSVIFATWKIGRTVSVLSQFAG